MATEEIWVGEDDVRRKLQGDELKAFLAMRKEIADAKAAEEAAEEAKVIAKAALLERLGITAEEAALLLA